MGYTLDKNGDHVKVASYRKLAFRRDVVSIEVKNGGGRITDVYLLEK